MSNNVENLYTVKNALAPARVKIISTTMPRKPAAVSMPPELHELASQRAATLGLNFSSYVNQLIREDMARGGSLTIRATGRGAQAAGRDVINIKKGRGK